MWTKLEAITIRRQMLTDLRLILSHFPLFAEVQIQSLEQATNHLKEDQSRQFAAHLDSTLIIDMFLTNHIIQNRFM